MANPAVSTSGALAALRGLEKAAGQGGLSKALSEFVNLRASQINGCSVCVDMHARDLKKAGESDERIWAVGAWRDAPYFTDAERAALALTEAVTRLSDRADPVPDDIYDEAAKHFSEPELTALILQITLINAWNRLNVSTRQVPGGGDDERRTGQPPVRHGPAAGRRVRGSHLVHRGQPAGVERAVDAHRHRLELPVDDDRGWCGGSPAGAAAGLRRRPRPA
jgi:AhpD family alkylhydroperoxidase